MKNTSAHLVLGAVGLLAANSPVLAQQVNEGFPSEMKMEALNAASLKSIESTWLQVPAVCKARGFNADPAQLSEAAVRVGIQAIYASYEA